jgi:pyridoxamine 5'-phosphate oxidase family protein
MSAFTEAEIEYLRSQRLGRLATLGEGGEPHVVPVGFTYNAALGTIDIGGHGIGKSKKFRDVGRDGRVAFVVDDVLPPWKPRAVEILGVAEMLSEGGKNIHANFDDELIRIHPTRIISWGIDGHERSSRHIEQS